MNVAVWILIGLVLAAAAIGFTRRVWLRRLRAALPAPAPAPAPPRKSGPPQTVDLGGRRFVRVTEWTVEADIWIMRKLRDSGLDKIEQPAGQSPDALVEGVLSRLWLSGAALELLGGFLRPADDADATRWSAERSVETGKFLGQLSDTADRMAVRGLFAEMLAYFFTTGLVSLKASPNSSSAPRAGAGSEAGPGSTNEASPITAAGPPPSSGSPAATPPGSASC